MICTTCNGTGFIGDNVNDLKIKNQEIVIGNLKIKYGLNGFIMAKKGHPVYDNGSRYMIYLEPEKSGIPKRVPFYKETLKIHVDFI